MPPWQIMAWAGLTREIGVGGDAAGTRYISVNRSRELYDRITGADSPITGITSPQIGSDWHGPCDDLVSDMQTYDHTLSAAEVACVAANGAGIFEKLVGPADLNGHEKADLGDSAALAADRLQAEIWP